MSKRIPRKLLERFITRKKLHGVKGFLRFVAQPRHTREFAKYTERHGVILQLPENLERNLLFHGSQRYRKQLTVPHSRKKFVYATDDLDYAIFLAILDLRNARAGVVVERGKTNLTVDLAFVNGPSSLKKGWVYVVSRESFKRTSNREYILAKPPETLFVIPVTPSDLTVPIRVK